MGNLIVFIVRFYLSVWFLLSISVVIYICLYNWFIPNYSITEAVFFRHDVSCKQMLNLYQRDPNYHHHQQQHQQLQNFDFPDLRCQHANYEVPNMNYKNFFKRGHTYHFELQLRMPDSTVNRNLGMFMIWLRFYDYDGKQIFHTVRPALYPYTSTILSLAKLIFFIPLYLFGYYTEACTIIVKLLDEHIDVNGLDFSEIYQIRLEIETMKPIEIIPPSKLSINASLKGIQYMMYFWPITSSILIIGCLFSIFFLIYLCSILRRTGLKSITTNINHGQDIVVNNTRFEQYFTDAPTSNNDDLTNNTCTDQLFDNDPSNVFPTSTTTN